MVAVLGPVDRCGAIGDFLCSAGEGRGRVLEFSVCVGREGWSGVLSFSVAPKLPWGLLF